MVINWLVKSCATRLTDPHLANRLKKAGEFEEKFVFH